MIALLKTATRIHMTLSSMQRVGLGRAAVILKGAGVPVKYLAWGRADRYYKKLQGKKKMVSWYFAFYKNDGWEPAWWLRLLNPGKYQHVVAFSQCDNLVAVIDPRESNTEILMHRHPEGYHLPLSADAIALDCCLRGADVVKIEYAIDKTPAAHSITNFFPGCVTIAKGVLGISDWVFTPWQFYCWLLDHGGIEYTSDKQDAIVETLVGCHLSDLQDVSVFKMLRGQS